MVDQDSAAAEEAELASPEETAPHGPSSFPYSSRGSAGQGSFLVRPLRNVHPLPRARRHFEVLGDLLAELEARCS